MAMKPLPEGCVQSEPTDLLKKDFVNITKGNRTKTWENLVQYNAGG